MARRYVVGTLALALAAACRGKPRDAAPDAAELTAVVDSLVPLVENAVGLAFRSPPRFALRTRDQVRGYLLAKLDQEFPAARLEGIQAAYQLLGLIPDTLDIKSLLLPLYAEQVAGYYDPDSTTLYAVEGADAAQLRLVLAHELVHALQHQQLPLDRMLKDVTNADRLAASQAILEGHATVAMLGVVLGGDAGSSMLANPGFWQQYREQVKEAQTSMPVFRSAPLILREGLIFPYLAGAEFIRWWDSVPGHPPLPEAGDLPRSTEQILHPDRYQRGDEPVGIRFADSSGGDVLHEDTMGELELQIWATVLRGGGEVLDREPLGWAGDRYRVFRTASGPALTLVTVWDDSTAGRRFAALSGARFAKQALAGYRTEAVPFALAGRPALRITRAPEGWGGWRTPPGVELTAP
ncbi:MAG: hypothetical protein AB7L66_09300 [Gemmatimonadales bacterium]